VYQVVNRILDEFTQEIIILYAEEDRKRGYITSFNREGRKRQFPFLTACAVMLVIPQGPNPVSIDEISSIIGDMKKAAKKDNEKIVCVSILKEIFNNNFYEVKEDASFRII
jgi:hypothetical protein